MLSPSVPTRKWEIALKCQQNSNLLFSGHTVTVEVEQIWVTLFKYQANYEKSEYEWQIWMSPFIGAGPMISMLSDFTNCPKKLNQTLDVALPYFVILSYSDEIF